MNIEEIQTMSCFTEALKDRIIEILSDYLQDLPFQSIRECTLYMESDMEDSLRLTIDINKIIGNERLEEE